jgi:hypothetical protein
VLSNSSPLFLITWSIPVGTNLTPLWKNYISSLKMAAAASSKILVPYLANYTASNPRRLQSQYSHNNFKSYNRLSQQNDMEKQNWMVPQT